MDIDRFHYDLPAALIAQYPCRERTGSRLLGVSGQSHDFRDMVFRDVVNLLAPGDLLVFNDTRVIPARILGRKTSGGQVEILVERVLGDAQVIVQISANRRPRVGQTLHLEADVKVIIESREQCFYRLRFGGAEPVLSLLKRIGRTPLPPYIERQDTPQDRERYQTVYACNDGAVAAPTAGLHFDQPLLDALQGRGVELGFLTLHVGAATFQPVRERDIREHKMHAERVVISTELCDRVQATRARGARVVAVGTTTVRALETAAMPGGLRAFSGESSLFIYPGYEFKVVDAVVTNFHLPCSTLLMMMCAFAGTERVLGAYRHAVGSGYRFYSYGDAMFLER